MKKLACCLVVAVAVCGLARAESEEGFISLFDGKSLEGWRVGDNAASFRVSDGKIVVNGPVGHLFYDGPVKGHNFRNFHFKAEVMTFAESNSGIYFHTLFQQKGWPSVGYEVQVNTSHKDPVKTGSVYGVVKNFEAPAKDEEWFTEEIIVRGKNIVTKVNGKTIVDFTEPEGELKGERKLSSGTFALQAHDPKSKVFFRNIRVKPLD